MNASTDDAETPSALQSYLELLRLPNVFTAVADVAMGFFFAIWGDFFVRGASWAVNAEDESLLPIGIWTAGLLVSASTSLYLAGMVLNDVFDIELDREEQPYRPLPSDRISLAAARWLGWSLLSSGVILAVAAAVLLERASAANANGFVVAWRPALVGAVLAGLIVLYNGWLKRTPLGPVAMGGCRALNVLLGMSVLRELWRIEHWIVAAGVGVYIAGVTWFARNDARRSDRRQLTAAALVMLAGVGLIGALPWLSEEIMRRLHQQTEPWKWLLLIAALVAFVIVRTAPAVAQPSPGPVRAAVGRSIMALIFLDAAACYAGAGSWYAILIALLVLPAILAGRWIQA